MFSLSVGRGRGHWETGRREFTFDGLHLLSCVGWFRSYMSKIPFDWLRLFFLETHVDPCIDMVLVVEIIIFPQTGGVAIFLRIRSIVCGDDSSKIQN